MCLLVLASSRLVQSERGTANVFSTARQFATDGAENPTLTIVSLAIRQADYLADQMKAKVIQVPGSGSVRRPYPPGQAAIAAAAAPLNCDWVAPSCA